MTKKMIKRLIFCLFSLATIGCFAQCYSPEDEELRKKIGQMILVGFRGTELTTGNTIYRDIVDYNVGGVILFEYDAPSGKRPRNITSRLQLQKMCKDMQKLRKEKLLISIDQEGGSVNRLKEKYGFPSFISAQAMGVENDPDTTMFYAALTGKVLNSTGINLNFAPCVDLNVNPKCPIIGKIGRSFSSDPMQVIKHAEIWINEQRKHGVISAIKHFPGHGSSNTDTHLGIANVSKTWTKDELIPYAKLIEKNNVDMIMTSHVFNAAIDSLYPATLSYKTLTLLLRKQMNFNGVIITDDLAMGAMTKHYSLDEIVELSILAGADMLCLSNNGTVYDQDIVPKVINIIYTKVKNGIIPEERINESYLRITNLKKKIK